MKNLCAALLGLLLASAAQAQTTFTMPPPAGVAVIGVQVVTTCNSVNLTANAVAFLAMDHTGALCTNASGGGGGGGAVTIADGADVAQGAIADAAATAGSTGTSSAKLRLITTQLNTLNTTLGTPFQAGGSIGNTTFASTQSGTWNITNISGTVSLPTGAATAANQATEIASLATIATASTASIPAGTNLIGNVGIVPLTSGGLATSSTIVATANGVLSVKGSAGQVYKIEVSNNQATVVWLKLYNSASAPTAGSGTPVRRILIPGNSSGVVFSASYEAGLAFSTGIGYALTGLIADNDTTAVTASVIVVNIDYK